VTARSELVDTAVDADASRLVELFKDLHRHPELGFAETRTAGIVAAELAGLGFAVTTGIGGTGVAAALRNGVGPTVMYRADMDALRRRKHRPGLREHGAGYRRRRHPVTGRARVWT